MEIKKQFEFVEKTNPQETRQHLADKVNDPFKKRVVEFFSHLMALREICDESSEIFRHHKEAVYNWFTTSDPIKFNPKDIHEQIDFLKRLRVGQITHENPDGDEKEQLKEKREEKEQQEEKKEKQKKEEEEKKKEAEEENQEEKKEEEMMNKGEEEHQEEKKREEQQLDEKKEDMQQEELDKDQQ